MSALSIREVIELISDARARRWIVMSVVGQLPIAMSAFTWQLVGKYVSDDLGFGSQLAAICLVSNGVVAPWHGRWIDRRGRATGIRIALLGTGFILLLTAALTATGGASAFLPWLAALQGATQSGVIGSLRAVMVDATPSTQWQRASVLDAVLSELVLVVGPALAGMIYALAEAPPVLVTMAVLACAGGYAAHGLPGGSSRESARTRRDHGTTASLWHSARLYGSTLAIYSSIGVVTVAVPIRVEELGLEVTTAGLFLSIYALGSMLGGVVITFLSVSAMNSRLVTKLLLLCAAVTLCTVALASSVPMFAVAVLLLGAPVAPLAGAMASAVQDAIPSSHHSEAFSWLRASMALGVGVGAQAGVATVEVAGSQPTFVYAIVGPIIGLVLILRHYSLNWVSVRREG